jgi:hypothetical protein
LDEAKEPLSPQDIGASTNMAPNNVWQLLFKMVQDGQVIKVGRGRYRHPDHPEPATPHKFDKAVRMEGM